MNNFFEKNGNNPANAYYPEAMSFDGAKFVKVQQNTGISPSNTQNMDFQSPSQTNANPLSFNNENNPFSNLFGGNMQNMLMNLLSNKMQGGNFDKSNLIMQALSSMVSPKKNDEIKDEKIIDVTQSFEDM